MLSPRSTKATPVVRVFREGIQRRIDLDSCNLFSVLRRTACDGIGEVRNLPQPPPVRPTTPGASKIQPPDEALVAGMAVGDEESAVTFVRRYQRRVFGLAVGMVSDHAMAEDIAQEALIRAWRHAPVFDARRGQASNWVLTITRNLAIDAIRQRRAVATDPDDLVALGLAAGGRSTEDLGVGGQLAPDLLAAIELLPVEQRRAIILAALYGRTAEEVSVSENIPLGTAKTRIRAGLQKLRATLTEAAGPGGQP
jgi:RNA polymerase sigma factor (sigma-70 family)